MTDQALDNLARRLLLDAARLEYSDLMEELPEQDFSLEFAKKMRKLVRRSNHPIRYRVAQIAACLLLAALLSGCTVLAISPEARAAFAGWMREVYENAFVYRFYGEAQEDRELLQETETFCRPAWVPEGYRIIRVTAGDGFTSIVYRDDSNALLVFTCLKNGGTVQVAGEGVYQTVQVNGRSADLYMDQDPEEANVLVWTDVSGESIFRISGVLSGEELVKMAESVEKVEKIAVYRPFWVPEGYRIIRAAAEDGFTLFVYRDDSGALVVFTCFKNGGTVQVAGEDSAVYQKVRVNGRSADLYMDQNPEEANVLVWTDASGESIFSITGVLSGEELVKMAESVEAIPRDVVYRPDDVPEGYFQVSVEDLDGCSVLTYRNKEAECLTVSYGYADLSGKEGAETSSVFVGENPANLYLDRAEEGVRHLTWVDGDSGVSFRVSGPLDGQALIRIGESMKKFPEPPPKDRQLTWVPAGYREIDRVRLTGQDYVSYQNDRGDRISFGYRPGIESSGLYVIPSGEKELTPQTVLVNGKEADLYLDEGSTNGLVWTEDGLLFSLLGYCSTEELVAMAESQEVILPDRRPSWAPGGYVLYERSFLHSKESATTIYENSKGGFLIFRCQPNETDRPFHLFPNEGSVEKQVSVNGHPADLYSNPEPGRISELCWSDEEAFYYLSGDLLDEEILTMAESVQKLPPIPATHIPTWLPLGYRDTSTSGGLWSREAEYENEAREQLQFRFARHGQVEEPMEECLEAIREAVAGLEGQEISVNGCPGRLYLGGSVNQLVWGAEEGETVYWLSGPLDGEVLLAIAGSVYETAE